MEAHTRNVPATAMAAGTFVRGARTLCHRLQGMPWQGSSLNCITIRPLLRSLAMIVPLSSGKMPHCPRNALPNLSS
jgi:hypothetical protein